MINLHRKSELIKLAFVDLFDAERWLQLAVEHESQLPGGDDSELKGIIAQIHATRSQLAGLWEAASLHREGEALSEKSGSKKV